MNLPLGYIVFYLLNLKIIYNILNKMDYFSRLFGCCVANRKYEENDFHTKIGKNDIISSEEQLMSIR